MSNGKDITIHLIAVLIKKTFQYFSTFHHIEALEETLK